MKGFDRRLCDAAWDNDTDAIAAILIDPALRARSDPETALIHAAYRGHATAVLMLLGHANPGARNSEALWQATKHRRGRCIELLAPVSAPEAWARWQWDDLSVNGRARLKRVLAQLGRLAPSATGLSADRDMSIKEDKGARHGSHR